MTNYGESDPTGIEASTNRNNYLGAITGTVIVLARQSLVDIPTVAVAIITLILLLTLKKKLAEPLIALVSVIVGLVIYPLTHLV